MIEVENKTKVLSEEELEGMIQFWKQYLEINKVSKEELDSYLREWEIDEEIAKHQIDYIREQIGILKKEE
jgi:hypothetical protein